MKRHLTNAVTIACLLGLVVLQFGWLFYPALGKAAALLNAAFLLACLAAYAARRFNRRSSARKP